MKAVNLIVLLLPMIAPLSTQNIDPECQAWRLPKNVLPRVYNLEIKNLNSEDFEGAVSITIESIEKTNTITLHAKNINITFDSITLAQKSKKESNIAIVNHTIDSRYEMIHLELESFLNEGESYDLNIPEFKSYTHGMDLEALFKTIDFRYNEISSVYNTFLEPANARQVFPCFDEPNMKAVFVISIMRDADQTSFSNMPIETTKPLSENRYLDIYKKTPLISTYNLALLVSDFVTYPLNGTTRTRIVVPKDEFVQIDLDLTYQVADDALRALESYTDVPYPLPKLDHVGVYDYEYNGMEHWGLIMYNRVILFRMNSTNAERKQNAYKTVIHETAHQWFGNLVTLEWWPYFWLNEAIPTYLQNIIGDKLVPEWRHNEQVVVTEFQKALRYDAEKNRESALPLTLTKICDINKDFVPLIGVSYEKGASVLRMFESILGSKQQFQTALRIYLKNSAYGNVKPNDLFEALDEVNHQFLKSHLPEHVTFETIGAMWTEQAGVPLVTVTRDYVSGTVHVKQERFYHAAKGKGQDTRWWIPLTWTASTSPESTMLDGPQDWLYEDRTLQLNIPADKWLLFNINATGYYRVNYDEDNWSLLARELETAPQKFSVVNRAQILDDAIQLGIAGRLDLGSALKVTRFLLNEEDRIVWMSATNNLQDLYKFASDNESVDPDQRIREYIKELMTRAYNLVRDKSGGTHLDKLMRGNVGPFACYHLEIPPCAEDMINLD